MNRQRQFPTWLGTVLGTICALLVLGLGAHAADHRGAFTEEFHQTYSLTPDGRVELDNINGAVHISTWDKNEVKVDAIKYADGSPGILVSVEETPEHIAIVVEDRGPGVPAESLTRVTERFYRLESRVPGSGLGLSIVTAIAHLHQGELQLEDAHPGLRARIVLPRDAASIIASAA